MHYIEFVHPVLARARQRGLARGLFVSTLLGLGASLTVLEVGATPPDREAWTTSRLVGSPDPPAPYTVERIYQKLEWKAPIYALAEPDTRRLLVVLAGVDAGHSSKIVRVASDPETSETPQTVLELEGYLIYGITLHPKYAENGQLFVFSHGPNGETEQVSRVTRYSVRREEPRDAMVDSMQTILEWRSMGHDGGDLAFGHDGMLYVTSGDGSSDSDAWGTGQSLNELNGGVLRIDVDHPSDGRAYSIPADNPFVAIPNARPEIWAYGLRNPWRITVDDKTGALWVGNNGQDLWESAHLLKRGENYGWSLFEGSHPFHAQGSIGPTPPVVPTIEHSHAEFRSLTGGIVYHGSRWSDLEGVYIYGDYSTGKIWGARYDGQQLTWHQELADTTLQIVGFATSPEGEVIVVDHAGGLYRLMATPPQEPKAPFPRRLSETGLFASVADYRWERGVVPYSVNAPVWHDGALADHALALPGVSTLVFSPTDIWDLPDGVVLVQTLSLPGITAREQRPRRMETRVMLKQQGYWAWYTYRWNEQQDDAELVESAGEDLVLPTAEATAGGVNPVRNWRIPSRSECSACHGRAAGFVLSMSTAQLLRTSEITAIGESRPQLLAFQDKGLFGSPLPDTLDKLKTLVDPYDVRQNLELRARSYLHVNCSGCHRLAGGGNARMELDFSMDRQAMNVLEIRPFHDTLGVADAQLIAPGQPDRSIIYQRIARRGRGQMPPLVSQVVDTQAVQLMHDWITSLKPVHPFVQEWSTTDFTTRLQELKKNRSYIAGKAAYDRLGCGQCHRFQQQGGGAGPDLTGIGRRVSAPEVLESVLAPSKKIAPEFSNTIIETDEGRIIEGRILHDTDDHLLLQTASSFAEPVKIAKAEIESQTPSKNSLMPTGITNTLTAEQVLDLLAYLIADGQNDHECFQPASP